MTSVAVVLLNYPSFEPDTRRCLASLRSIEEPALTPVVVEQSGSAGDADRIRSGFPEAVVLSPERNLGFAGGNNVGIRYALDRDFDYVMVLNNDTEVADGRIVADMVRALESNERLGLIGPRVFDAVKGEEQTVTLTPPSWTLRQRLFRRPAHSREPIAAGTVSVEGISGVCWLVPARVFRDVGLLDDAIFLYAEDNELCYRVRGAGWLIGQYRDRIGIRHYLTSTVSPSLSSLRHRFSYVHHLYALRKHGASFALGSVFVLRVAVMLLWHLLTRSPKGALTAEGIAYLRIVRDLVRQLAAGQESVRLLPSASGSAGRET